MQCSQEKKRREERREHQHSSVPQFCTKCWNTKQGGREEKEGRKKKKERAAEPLRALAALAEDQGPVPSMNITTTREPSVLGALMPSAWTGLWMLVLDVTSQKHTYI